jgi:hypothetical protein
LEKNSAVASKKHPQTNWCSADGVIKCVAVRNETAKACVAIPTNNELGDMSVLLVSMFKTIAQ